MRLTVPAHRIIALLRLGASFSPVEYILAALPFSVAFGSLATLPLGPLRATPTDALVAALVAWWGWDEMRAGQGLWHDRWGLNPPARKYEPLRAKGRTEYEVGYGWQRASRPQQGEHKASPLQTVDCASNDSVEARFIAPNPSPNDHLANACVGAIPCGCPGSASQPCLKLLKSPRCSLIIALVALVTLMMLSLAWAADRALAVKEIIKWGEALAVIVVAPRYLRDRRALGLVLGAVIASASIEALLGIAQGTLLAGDLPVSADRGVRVVGTFGQPNPYSGYLNLALPLLLALAAWAEDARLRLASGGLALVLGAALALAQSRGAIIGLGAALLAMAWCGWPRARRWIAGGLTTGACGVVGLLATGHLTLSVLLEKLGWRPLTDAALSRNVTDANFSTLERLAHWAAAARMVTAHPLTGIGAGNYPVAYHLYAVPRWQLPLGHAHNLYLNMAAELGIPGALAYLAVVAAGLWGVMRAVTHDCEQPILQVGQPGGAEPGQPGGAEPGQPGGAEIGQPQGIAPTGQHGNAPFLQIFVAFVDFRGLRVPVLLGILGATVAVAAHNMVDDLTTHGMLLEQMLLLACVQSHLFARLR